MIGYIAATILALTLSGLVPIGSAHARDYYEWSTRKPFSGWVGGGRRSYYCDYIKYPVRDCDTRQVCKRGKCRTTETCRVVGWDIRQSCY